MARQRVAAVLPHIDAIRRLRALAKQLASEDLRDILDELFTDVVQELKQFTAPWERIDPSPTLRLSESKQSGLEKFYEVFDRFQELNIEEARLAIKTNDPSSRRRLASDLLEKRGFDFDPDGDLFRTFCIEVTKLEVLHREGIDARARGQLGALDDYVEHFKQSGYKLSGKDEPSSDAPRLSAAWQTYYKEKTLGRPEPDWSENTAAGQQATFDEFLEIVGDVPVETLSRDAILGYLDTTARLPKNRHKRFPDASIEELLDKEFPQAERASSRTIKEKLTRLSSFLRWCRDIKGYLTEDPCRGVRVRSESRRYSAFSQDDLEALFGSEDYLEGRHSSCWKFWVPLVALYTGARQAEIAQLLLSDVSTEDNIAILAISDGEGRRVKTRAAVRKVPISPILKSLGFLDYVATLRLRGESRLFPDLPLASRSPGQRVSRWFGDTYRKRCGIAQSSASGRKVFHSFRHTAITKALSAGLPIQHCQQVFGHEASILGETATYTHQFSPEVLMPVIQALNWELDHRAYAKAWKPYVEDWE